MSEPEAQPSPETYPAGKTKYFVKEIASNPVNVRLPQPDGTFLIARVPFEDLGDDTGFLSIDDPTKIVAIRNLIRSRRGGIREVGKEEFEDAKKVASVQEQRRALLRPKSLLNQPLRSDIKSDGAVGGDSARPAPKFPDPSVPSEMVPAKIPELTPSALEARTPKPRRKSAPKTESKSATVNPPLAFSGATVEA